MRRPRADTRAGASLLVYVILLAFAMLEQLGRTTSDTKTPLIERPGAFLHEAATLWDPSTNFGELQNQAYGYLFPQGPFFLLGHLAQVPPWVTERLWTVLIVVVAAEGARLLARAIGLDPWAAWVAGMAFGLNPRLVGQAAVRSAEILPTAVLPWVALPVVLALTGRLDPRRAALLSAVAFMFSGAVNGTATAAGLPLVVVLIGWGVRRGLVGWSLLGWWSGLVVLTSFWWAASLLRLNAYSPPFFDFVEDAKATTATTGYTASLRGLSNWVDYAYLGTAPNWPAGYAFAYEPALVVASGVLAAAGVIGLVTLAPPWRAPLVVAATLGLVCLTIAHTGPLESPLGPFVQRLLDGGFALLRNVSKADPMLRLPLCLGMGGLFARLVARRQERRTRVRSALVVVLAALVLGMAQPAVAMELRTPGWTKVPDYWSQAADYLHDAPGRQQAWLVPGSGFGLQTWGWTFDEPFQAVARTPWVSRSQVPLTPPPTIRILSTLEHFLESGSGSPDLGAALGRLGIGYVVVRHDLDEAASDTTTSNLVAIALARSRGVERVATFGALDFGPAIEIYRVTSSAVAPALEVRPLSEVVTTASASSDVIDAVVGGLVGPRQPAVVQGDDGWDRPAEVVGDSFRDRERNFGRVHEGEGPVRASGEPRYGGRVVADYPANEESRPVRASYDDGAQVTASSSQAWTNGLGRVAPESAPYSAVDGDVDTGWQSAFYQRPRGQWLEVRWPRAHELGRVSIRTPVDDEGAAAVTRWRVAAGTRRVLTTVDPFTGLARVDLRGVSATRLRITVDRVRDDSARPVAVMELSSDATPIGRTLVLPRVALADRPSFVFSAQPETRACISTLLGPDCSQSRKAVSEESTGIDRTFEVPRGGSWSLSGTTVTRSRLATDALLNPLGSRVVLHASSQWLSDPAVSVRLAYDGASTTSWIADPRDGSPVLTVDFDRPRRIDRIAVGPPASPAVSPVSAVLRSRDGNRRVELGEFGQFPPLTTNHLTITFTNRTRGVSPIGISELYLPPARIATPLDGGEVTGSVCGFGPVLRVDGRRYDTVVRGFIGDVVSAGPLHFESCSGPVRLGPGRHRVRLTSTEQFQPVTALLRAARTSTARGSSTVPARARLLSEVTGSPTHQTMDVGAGPASILSTTRNTNRGWQATLNGKRLQTMVSDGWAQAWRLPAGSGGQLIITYGPQRAYLICLYAGLAVAGLVLLTALVLLPGTRLAPLRRVAVLEPTPWSRRRRLLGGVLALPVAWVLGGLPALAGVVVALVVRRPGWLRWLAFACLVAAPVVTAVQLLDGPRLRSDPADALAGAGFVLALATVALGSRTRSAVEG
jgi:arabinofuranan 3-O-arabinosyltransferase